MKGCLRHTVVYSYILLVRIVFNWDALVLSSRHCPLHRAASWTRIKTSSWQPGLLSFNGRLSFAFPFQHRMPSIPLNYNTPISLSVSVLHLFSRTRIASSRALRMPPEHQGHVSMYFRGHTDA